MDIEKLIKEKRPTSKDSTIKANVSRLNLLKKMMKSDDWDFLDDVSKIEKSLNTKHYTTQRNYYNSIIVLLDAMGGKEDIIEQYTTIRDKLNEQYIEENNTGKISEKQKDNFVDREVIITMLKKMEKEIRDQKLKKKDVLNNFDKELFTVYTIYSLLLHLPIRNDMANMKYVKKSGVKEDEFNYLVKDKNKMYIILNNYKTNKTFGQKELTVPPQLKKVFNMYIKYMKKDFGDTLFVSSRNNPLNRNQISQLLLKTSQKYLNKNISTTMMRKIVLSDKFAESNEDKKKMANIAGHSVSTMDMSYVKTI